MPNRPQAKGLSLETAVATGAVTLGLAALAAPSAEAATFNVTNLNDSGAGSLRQAIIDANAAAGPDVITFQSGLTGTITLTTGELNINDSVDIQGPGAATVTVSGNNVSRVFYAYSPAVTPIDVRIAGLTITKGFASLSSGAGVESAGENLTLDKVVVTGNVATGAGGGVAKMDFNGSLHVLSSTISGNTAARGGGIYLYDTYDAPANIQDSVISGNSASRGAGIYLYGPSKDVTIARTTISGNITSGVGGGIFLYHTYGGQLIIDSSTISGNTANAGSGGGAYFYNPRDPILITNTTISGNSASYGGGLYFYGGGSTVTINFSTIAGNTGTTSGGGISAVYPVTINNSIVADNISPTNPDLSGSTFTLDHTLVETPGSATIVAGTGVITGTDPALGPLQNNGGPTPTERPGPASVVINAGDPAYVPPPATDQRGGPRKVGAIVDMGAVEVNGGTIQLSAATYSVAENGGSVAITLSRTGGTDPATVNYATSNGTATAGADYTNTSGTASFAAGATTATFNVPILDDQIVEGNETFNVALTSPSPGAALGAQSAAVVTITDFEEGKLQLSAATGSVGENGGSITITVNRVSGSNGAVSVNFATSNGTATAGADYTTTSGTLNWANGDTAPKTFNVPILDDQIVEGNETFNVTLSAPGGGAQLGATTTETVTIVDFEEGKLQLSAATGSVSENGGSIVITVNRVSGSDGAVSVNFATSNGTATAGADYTATSGTLNWANGDTAPKTFSVPILTDSLVEGNETFNVTLSAPGGGAQLGVPTTDVVTIVDVPPPGSVQFSAATASLQESAGPVVVTVTRTGGSAGPLTVNYTTVNGSATAPSDYATTSGSVTFADGDTVPKTITIPIVSDNIPEPTETFTVTLSSPSAGSLGAQSTITVSITPPQTEIPALGTLAKIFLAIVSALTGLFMLDRKRIFSFFFILLATGALCVTTLPAHAALHTKPGKHVKIEGVLTSVTTVGANITFTLQGGKTLTYPTAKVTVIDRRTGVKPTRSGLSSVHEGTKVRIVERTDKAGSIAVTVKLLK